MSKRDGDGLHTRAVAHQREEEGNPREGGGKPRTVTFPQGPLAHCGSRDGHPSHEGQTASRVRDLGNSWGKAMRINKSAIKVGRPAIGPAAPLDQ